MSEGKNVGGRPRKPIDWDEFERLCNMQCTQKEMAGFFRILPETLKMRAEEYYGKSFPDIHEMLSEGGKPSLRRAQFKMAHKNAAMAIWLGKQWLGQKENSPEVIISPEASDQFEKIMNQMALHQSKEDQSEALSGPNSESEI